MTTLLVVGTHRKGLEVDIVVEVLGKTWAGPVVTSITEKSEVNPTPGKLGNMRPIKTKPSNPRNRINLPGSVGPEVDCSVVLGSGVGLSPGLVIP
jgi:hypothetical protein